MTTTPLLAALLAAFLAASLALSSGGCAVVGADTCRCRDYTGVLRGGMMAVGGETTGWVLERDGDPAVRGVVAPIDLDAADLDPDRLAGLDGRRVTVRGHVGTRDYVERGPTPVLVARSVRAAE